MGEKAWILQRGGRFYALTPNFTPRFARVVITTLWLRFFTLETIFFSFSICFHQVIHLVVCL